MDIKKIAVISDIHAHQDVLEAFLKYIKEEKIDIIFNLGDFVSGGAEPCQVYDRIMNNRQFININGFDEQELFSIVGESKNLEKNQKLREILGEKRLKYLRQLPKEREIKIGNKKMLFLHRNGASDIAQQLAHGKERHIEGYDYIFCGGSHKQELTHMRQPFIKGTIIDPGSLATLAEGIAHFVIIELDNKKIDITFKSLKLSSILSGIKEEPREVLMHIYQTKHNVRGEKILPPPVIKTILEIALKQSKYVSIGCWDYEKKLIKELLWHLKCRGFKKCINSGQEWYIGEVSKEVEKLLIEKNTNEVEHFKWLEISFQQDLDEKLPIYSIYHYGSECFLRYLLEEDKQKLEEILKENNISYTIDTSISNKTKQAKQQAISYR